jgi:DNA-binding MarR family transcriptional regulator
VNKLIQYIKETIGIDFQMKSMPKNIRGKLPLYITERFDLHEIVLFNQVFILAESQEKSDISILQTEKQLLLVKNALNKKVILCLEELSAINRKKLIEKGINFIVPGKQLFLPEIWMDLRETFNESKTKKESQRLLPSAQMIVLWHILHRNETIEKYSFKQLAQKFNYTQMAITKAVEDLKFHELVTVEGRKEKFIRFISDRKNLWQNLEQEQLLTSPVLKKVFTDEKPDVEMLPSNESALPEYTDMNPGSQICYAIDKNIFQKIEKKKPLLNANPYEGRYCLEVWKYNPVILADGLEYASKIVDPLSLYLSLKNSSDERIKMALDQIIEKTIW